MTVLQKDNYTLKALCRQDVESRNSHVNRINFALNSFDFERQAAPVPFTAALRKYQGLFEAVYGYRQDDKDPLKRTTPSAGALYPTELLLLHHLEGQWQLLYYNFRQHCFFRVAPANLRQLLDDLKPTSDRSVMLVYSDFGRTIQKYGVRAFRYLYLDASFVLYNTWLLAATWKKNANLALHFPRKSARGYLPAPASNTLLFSLALSNDFDAVPLEVAACTPAFAEGSAPASSIAYPNIYNANLLRAQSFYAKACADNQAYVARLDYGGPELHPEDVLHYLLNRRSVKTFADQAVPLAQYTAVRQEVRAYADKIKTVLGTDDFELACLPVNVEGTALGVEYLMAGVVREVAAASRAELSAQIVAACQDQIIMRHAAFVVVVLVNVNKRNGYSTGYIDYVKGALFGGLVCANLYQSGLFNKVGTTTIGGFSEKLLGAVLGQEGYLPMVVQAFGVPDNTIAKYDNSTVVAVR
ncbi:hypothetical protein E5K00_14485 [Hymenobacter aquaticus]|uniref:SagB/ThcOx family dehydrogenase n=1 Tax=Hymenobacter aquaticus TaxID=1867101 RepID=A0A4Z0PUM8_9BACT|nr:hypothetical protein [Hymenobacter aquaticus]TGE21490.1 hypothetical protein E5K00_14485 [Hymenobacter aquaticus]